MDNNSQNDNVVVPSNTNVSPVEPEVFTDEVAPQAPQAPQAPMGPAVLEQPVSAPEPVQSTPAQETAVAQEPVVQQPVQAAEVAPATPEVQPVPQAPSTTPNVPTQPAKSKKKVNNKVVLLALIVLIVFGIGYYYMGNKKNPVMKKNPTPTSNATEKKINKIETGVEWGDEYSVEAQRFFDTFDAIDVAFVDLDFNDSPEMIVKYTEEKKTSLQVFYLTTSKAVSSSKAFANAELNLIYSLIDGKSRFYVHVKTSDKYGIYIETEKIIAGTVKKGDIETYNDKQVSAFKENYVVSNYDVTFYEVKKGSFAENFKTMIDRYERYNNEIEDEKDKLEEDNKANVVKKDDDNDSLITYEYKVAYGKYTPDELHITDGSINPNVYINKDGTITIGEETFRFEVNSLALVLENGKEFTVIGNDAIRYEDNGGIIYRAENPINMTEKEKRELETEIKKQQREEENKKKEKPREDVEIIS